MRARARFQLQLQLRLLRLKIAARAEDAETLRPSGTCEGNAEEDPAAGPLDVESCSRVRCWGDVQLGGGYVTLRPLLCCIRRRISAEKCQTHMTAAGSAPALSAA